MAENTFITGVADGAFENALGDLPPWATQVTLEEVAVYLEKSLNIQTQGFRDLIDCCKKKAGAAGGGDSERMKEFNMELDKTLRSMRRKNELDEAERKRLEKQEKTQQEGIATDTMRNALGKAFNNIMGLVVSTGTKVFEAQKQYVVTSNDLFKSVHIIPWF
jgi:HPt (histidine-containing phosphotransfer) domain-containing protein